jgi:hypothetical protein
MSKKILSIAHKGIKQNSIVVANSRALSNQFNCELNPLNNLALSRYANFLIVAGLVTVEQARVIKTYDDVRAILKRSLVVVSALKRSCAFKLGELTLIANKYSVISYFLNENYPFDGLCCEEFPWCDRLIIDVMHSIGVDYVPIGGGERMYDYTALKVLSA